MDMSIRKQLPTKQVSSYHENDQRGNVAVNVNEGFWTASRDLRLLTQSPLRQP